jgi:hypothetical protein
VKWLQRLTRTGAISRISAFVCHAYHHAVQLVKLFCLPRPLLVIHAQFPSFNATLLNNGHDDAYQCPSNAPAIS